MKELIAFSDLQSVRYGRNGSAVKNIWVVLASTILH